MLKEWLHRLLVKVDQLIHNLLIQSVEVTQQTEDKPQINLSRSTNDKKYRFYVGLSKDQEKFNKDCIYSSPFSTKSFDLTENEMHMVVEFYNKTKGVEAPPNA